MLFSGLSCLIAAINLYVIGYLANKYEEKKASQTAMAKLEAFATGTFHYHSYGMAAMRIAKLIAVIGMFCLSIEGIIFLFSFV